MKEKNCSGRLSENYLNSFSHIYIEKEILGHEVTEQILKRLPKAQRVLINNYRDIFNRPRQNYIIQKRSQKLILAKKKFDFIYPGSGLCENFGEEHFYYSSSIMNCFYECEYCYLQGMYPSGNIVIFVNLEDYFSAVDELTRDKKIYLCLSYESDLLAFENLTGFTGRWIHYARNNANVLVEIRTKSANFNAVADKEIPRNVIFAWTLSPQEVIQNYEAGAPSLEARLNSIRQAIAKGLKVRLSLEPLIMIDDLETVYKNFIHSIFAVIPPEGIRDVNIGVFRMSREHMKRISKLKKNSKVFAYEMNCVDGNVSYKQEREMKQIVYNEVIKYLEKDKVY
jgi:spore photoproduct lyase